MIPKQLYATYLAPFSLHIFSVPFRLLMTSFYTMQLLDLVEQNELNRSLLTLLDQNIASAYQGNQVREIIIAFFMLYVCIALEPILFGISQFMR